MSEDYNNVIEEQIEEEKKQEEDKVIIDNKDIYIEGQSIVYPYDEVEYIIKNTDGGVWEINSTKATIVNQTSVAVLVAITTGRSGEFELIYRRENKEDVVLVVTIESL